MNPLQRLLDALEKEGIDTSQLTIEELCAAFQQAVLKVAADMGKVPNVNNIKVPLKSVVKEMIEILKRRS